MQRPWVLQRLQCQGVNTRSWGDEVDIVPSEARYGSGRGYPHGQRTLYFTQQARDPQS